MTVEQKTNVRFFRNPAPVRETGQVTYRYFLKEGLNKALKEEVLASYRINEKLKEREVVEI